MESLPHDVVLSHIFHRLDFTSKVRLAAVCRSWRQLLSHRLSPHLPCLCVSRPPSSPSESNPEFSVLDLSSPTTARRPGIAGTNGPYLITTRTLRIYNTLTGESTPLPKTAICILTGHNFPLPLPLRMARVSGPPTSKPGECVAAAADKNGEFYICRLGIDGKWIWIWNIMWDVTFRRRRLFCTCPVAFLRVNMDNPDARLLLIMPKHHLHRDFEDSYVVESCGELLVVTLYRPYDVPWDASVIKFLVHRWEKREEAEEEEEFVRVHDLGDRMLFIGNGCSRSWSGDGSDVDGFFTRNCIYYVPPSRRPSPGDESEPTPSYRLWKFYVNEEDHIAPLLYPHPISSSTPPKCITLGTN